MQVVKIVAHPQHSPLAVDVPRKSPGNGRIRESIPENLAGGLTHAAEFVFAFKVGHGKRIIKIANRYQRSARIPQRKLWARPRLCSRSQVDLAHSWRRMALFRWLPSSRSQSLPATRAVALRRNDLHLR